jgi:hypothetical protein
MSKQPDVDPDGTGLRDHAAGDLGRTERRRDHRAHRRRFLSGLISCLAVVMEDLLY